MDNKAMTKHYQLETQSSWLHTWYKPTFKFLNSEHFNGQHFFNRLPAPDSLNRKDLWKWLLTRKSQTWQYHPEPQTDEHSTPKIMPRNRPNAALNDWQVWFIGHATVLIQIGPYNFLTDPVWCEYASPFAHSGPKRMIPMGIALEDLPEIDAVFLSHNHYDHMDLATLEWLHVAYEMPIYTGLGNAWYLPKHYQVIEMVWWQTEKLGDFDLVYTPAQHGSGRGLRDQNHALWGGFSLLHETGHCFFAGDTGYSPHFKEIKTRLGAPRIALLPIGAYEPRHLMRYLHMNPEDAYHAHQDLQAKFSMAIHYRTFQLTDEGRDQPEQDLQDILKTGSKLINPFVCIHEGKRLIV